MEDNKIIDGDKNKYESMIVPNTKNEIKLFNDVENKYNSVIAQNNEN